MATAELTTITLGPELNGVTMTPAEFDAVDEYDDSYSYELIKGVLIVNPLPYEQESDPNEELGHWLRVYRDTPESTLDVTLAERHVYTTDSRRRADRVIWCGLGRKPTRDDVPTIVVEFVSKSKRDWKRDYVEKRQEYLQLGVVEYWVIDRFQRTMSIFQTTDPAETILKESPDAVYTTDLLPGFELPLARLLAVADDWDD